MVGKMPFHHYYPIIIDPAIRMPPPKIILHAGDTMAVMGFAGSLVELMVWTPDSGGMWLCRSMNSGMPLGTSAAVSEDYMSKTHGINIILSPGSYHLLPEHRLLPVPDAVLAKKSVVDGALQRGDEWSEGSDGETKGYKEKKGGLRWL